MTTPIRLYAYIPVQLYGECHPWGIVDYTRGSAKSARKAMTEGQTGEWAQWSYWLKKGWRIRRVEMVVSP